MATGSDNTDKIMADAAEARARDEAAVAGGPGREGACADPGDTSEGYPEFPAFLQRGNPACWIKGMQGTPGRERVTRAPAPEKEVALPAEILCSPARVERYQGKRKPACNDGRGCAFCWEKFNRVRYGGEGHTKLVKQRKGRRRS